MCATTVKHAGFCQCWMAVDEPVHHSTYKIINFDDEIMEIGLICSNLIEKIHQSWAES
jgi:hypothetical protein